MNPDLIALAILALAFATGVLIAVLIQRADRPAAAPAQPEVAHEYWDDGHLAELDEWATEPHDLPADLTVTGEMPAVTPDEPWDYQPRHLRIPPYVDAEGVSV